MVVKVREATGSKSQREEALKELAPPSSRRRTGRRRGTANGPAALARTRRRGRAGGGRGPGLAQRELAPAVDHIMAVQREQRQPPRRRDAENTSTSHWGQAERGFKVELEAIGRVRHKNLVRLLGYCAEGAQRYSSENNCDVDALVSIEYALKYPSMIGGIENVKQSQRMIKSLLTEKQNKEEMEHKAEGYHSGQEKLSRVDIEIKLREEAMISRVLKEKLLAMELDIEQLQSDLAASVRVQEVLQNEIQRVKNVLRCLTHKYKHLEIQGLKRDEIITVSDAKEYC